MSRKDETFDEYIKRIANEAAQGGQQNAINNPPTPQPAQPARPDPEEGDEPNPKRPRPNSPTGVDEPIEDTPTMQVSALRSFGGGGNVKGQETGLDRLGKVTYGLPNSTTVYHDFRTAMKFKTVGQNMSPL